MKLSSKIRLFLKVTLFYFMVLFHWLKYHVVELDEMCAEKIKKKFGDTQCLLFKRDRLETFNKNWTDLGFKYCTPEHFAGAGFYNCNTNVTSDTVKCFSCQKELSDWEEEDDPWQEHVKRGSKCPFVLFKSKENPTMQDFLELQYETKKILLINYFEQEKKSLLEKEKMLLKKISQLEKSRK